ncbi:MAG: ABC transporter permease [Nibricoccus sp.]
MNLKTIITVYRKELKDMLRDRRAIMSMIIIPTFIMPAMIFGMSRMGSKAVSKAHEEIPAVMIIDGEDSPAITAALKASKKIHVVPARDDWQAQISDKKIRAAVRIPAGFEASLRADSAGKVTIYNYEGELRSSLAVGELERFFRDLREKTVATRLSERSLPATFIRPFDIARENVAAPEKVSGNMLGGFIPYLIIVLGLTGAMYPAMDLTAGEKERGTMETLLCTPAARTEIVLGKFFMVLTGSVSAMVLSLLSMGISFGLIGATAHGGKMANFASSLPPVNGFAIAGVLVMALPTAIFFSALIFTASVFAKSYKEAQTYAAPLMILAIMPSTVGMMPGVELSTALTCIPVLGVSLVCKEMLSGIWHWPYIVAVFGSSCLYATIALSLAVYMFKRESVIFRT